MVRAFFSRATRWFLLPVLTILATRPSTSATGAQRLIRSRSARADGANVIFNRSAVQNTFNLKGAQHLTIKGFEFTGGSTSVRIFNDGDIPSKFITLDGNHFHHTGGQAIAANVTGSTYEGLRFVNNEINDTGAEGEAFYLGCNNNTCQFFDGVIENNYIHDLVDPGNGVYQGDGIELKLGSYNNVIRNNVIVNTNYPGITVYGVEGQGARNLIEGNVLIAIQDHGIQSASDAIVQNNLVLSALYDGIHVQNHQGAVIGNLDILNNTVRSNVGNDYNTSFISGHAIRVNNPTDDTWSGPVLIANNALYPDGPDTFQSRAIGSYQLTPGGVTAINNIGSATGNDVFVDSSGNLLTDFVDILNLNAFPLAGSKLIGAGDASQQPGDDFNGTTRAGSNDVGAYRYDLSGNPGWTVAHAFKPTAAAGPGIAGDFNNNGIVDAADYTLWRDNLGTNFDLNGNGDEAGGSAGVVDAADYTLWATSFGNTASTSTSTTIPEPSTLLLLTVGLPLLGRRRAS